LPAPSHQLQRLRARVPILADDDVVVHGDPKRPGHVDDGLGHLDVRACEGRGIAGGLIVQETAARSSRLMLFDFYVSVGSVGSRSGGGKCFQFLIIPFVLFESR
jgi:hypothetical protein